MAVKDNELILSDDEAPFTSPDGGSAVLTQGTRTSAHVYRRGPLDAGNVSNGDFALTHPGVYLDLRVTTAPTSEGEATINVQLVSSAAAALSAPTVHWQSGVLDFDDALFGVNKFWTIALNPNQDWLEYVGLLFIIATADLTAFKTKASIVPHVDRLRTFATGMVFGY